METLEIHSKDFLVKWVHAPDNSVIDWQVKPLKKSINFAIYKKNEEDENCPLQPPPPSYSEEFTFGSRLRSNSAASVNNITEQFKSKSRSSTFSSNLNNSDLTLLKNYYKLVADELVHGNFKVAKGGMYAFIFDNSFSKTTGKKVYFSTKIIDSAPPNGIYRRRLSLGRTPTVEKKSIQFQNLPSQAENDEDLFDTQGNILRPKNGELLQSVLLKRRRKKLQGFTKRFFVLNFKYGTLSYFRANDNKLRGQMPIKQSIISANSKNREIIIDSGMEVWDLKALNEKDFKTWVDAFNQIKKFDDVTVTDDATIDLRDDSYISRELEALASKLDTLKVDSAVLSSKRLGLGVDDISRDIQKLLSRIKNGNRLSMNGDALSVFSNEFFDASDYMSSGVVLLDQPVDDRGNALDAMVGSSPSDSSSKDDDQFDSVSSSSSLSEEDDAPVTVAEVSPIKNVTSLDDNDSNLYPLPHEPIKRECEIPVCNHTPPSILAFVRKNVGKDLSTIAMPVDMNEPVTTLQRYSEMIEYCDLINKATQPNFPAESGEKILRIASFAISFMSSVRCKERTNRKPFNPLLGETFELVREDFGIRLVSEKVSHRPLVVAFLVESEHWTLSFSPAPSQKFWGKSAEIITKGLAKLTIKETGEVFSWAQPNTLLKNIIAGEKYSEPTSTMTIKSSTGYKAVIEFAKGGMFSGRSEDLTIKAYDSAKNELPYTVSGKWTESLTLKTNSTEKLIWQCGDLLSNPNKKFGFTTFTGTLNKITDIERGMLPHTDSRLRPDMKVYENGDIAQAEILKAMLEEGQRQRRKELETIEKPHVPTFFKNTEEDGSGDWVYITGEKSYWNRRKNQDWDDLVRLW